MALDIREKFKKTLVKYGRTVIYVRTDQRFRCECYVERSGESADSNCTKCFGTSYKSSVEKILARRTNLTMPETKAALRRVEQAGVITVTGYTYYMEHTVEPKSGDLIIEVEWKNGLPAKIKEKLRISVAEGKEGLHGRIEFYQVYTRTDWFRDGDLDAINKN